MKHFIASLMFIAAFTLPANADLADNAVLLPNGLVAVKISTEHFISTYLLIKVISEGNFRSCKIQLPIFIKPTFDIECFKANELIEANHNGY